MKNDLYIKESPWGWDIVGSNHSPPAELSYLAKDGKVLSKIKGLPINAMPTYMKCNMYKPRIFKTKKEAEKVLNKFLKNNPKYRKRSKPKFKKKGK